MTPRRSSRLRCVQGHNVNSSTWILLITIAPTRRTRQRRPGNTYRNAGGRRRDQGHPMWSPALSLAAYGDRDVRGIDTQRRGKSSFGLVDCKRLLRCRVTTLGLSNQEPGLHGCTSYRPAWRVRVRPFRARCLRLSGVGMIERGFGDRWVRSAYARSNVCDWPLGVFVVQRDPDSAPHF